MSRVSAEVNAAGAQRWLLLALQLPARPSNARVLVWRRLQQLGAVAVKHAVYVLPNTMQALEDFAWVQREVTERGGHATVFSASTIEDVGNTELIEQFKAARAADYTAFLNELRRAFPRRAGRRRQDPRDLRSWRERLDHIRQIDFFSAPGSAEAEAGLEALERAARNLAVAGQEQRPLKTLDRRSYAGRIWLTRPRPGVDRFACAWLIRRFIDPAATFLFSNGKKIPADTVPFDMYEHEGFGHHGERCTFEVMQWRFAIIDRAVSRIAEIVHDVDLKDDRFHARHAAAIELLVNGLRETFTDDHALLEHGISMFDALYHGLSAATAKRQTAGPRT
ncbi:MAG: chromate resistance protein [Vicinamibacterales bacterium]